MDIKKEELQQQIEKARVALDKVFKEDESVEHSYQLSLELDELIERYIEMCEKEKIS